MEKQTLELIIEGCKNNERKFQNELYKSYVNVVYSVAFKYFKDKSTADDIVQTSFLKIYDNIGKFKFEGSFEGWIRRVVRNHSIDIIRRNRNDVEYVDNLITNDCCDDIDNTSIKEEMINDILKLSDNLSESYGLVFKMYFLDEMSHKSIANKLGIHEGTSKSNLHKAKNKIIKKLKNKVYES
jgi:RNA polymerase sigma factor (sigma-70 family)